MRSRLLLFILSCTYFSALCHNAPNFARIDTLQPVNYFWNETFCTNQFIIINNHLYGPDNTTGTEILPHAASNGCDSIVHIAFTFTQPVAFLLEQNLCDGDTLWVAGEAYHALRYLGDEIIENGAINGCDSIIHVQLNVFPTPKSILTDTLCANESIEINGHIYNQSNPNGLERIPGVASGGCDSLLEIKLVFRDFNISLDGDRTISLGDTVCLSAQFQTNPQSLSWVPPLPCQDTFCTSACIQPEGDVTYMVVATDSFGCAATAQTHIRVSNEINVFFPNVFSLTGTPPNDRFFVGTGPIISNIRLLVVADRWGNILFSKENIRSNHPEDGWDGYYKEKKVLPGVYVFYADLELFNGSILKKKGDITVLR